MARNDAAGHVDWFPHGDGPGALDALSVTSATPPSRIVERILEAARAYLEVELVFVGQFASDRQLLRWSSGDAASFGFPNGAAMPLSETYCGAMIEGRLPGTVSDTRENATARALEVTRRGRIGAYVGVPIHLSDGRLFGTVCALSHEARPGFTGRHERLLGFFSSLIGEQISRLDADVKYRRVRFDRIRKTLDAARNIRIALQPIVDLESGFVAGEEALARFADMRSPVAWFAEAWDVGLGTELELATLRFGGTLLDQIPAQAYLSVNVSPQTVMAPGLKDILGELQPTRLVLEMTEHRDVEDYPRLLRALDPYRDLGVRLAVDDVGAGFASLSHVLQLHPDIIKLDSSLTHAIDRDSARQALVSSLLTFSARIGAAIVAEGIETEHELAALRILGIGYGQGHFLGRPGRGLVKRTPRGLNSPVTSPAMQARR